LAVNFRICSGRLFAIADCDQYLFSNVVRYVTRGEDAKHTCPVSTIHNNSAALTQLDQFLDEILIWRKCLLLFVLPV
jgi:hypothetical protein